MHGVTTIDCRYAGQEGFAAAYLLVEGAEAAFVETNTTHAVPRLLRALEQSGRGPEAVVYVIVTHVHLDHAGGAAALMEACPNATLLAHPKAARHLVDPERLVKSSIAVYGEQAFRELYGEVRAIPRQRVQSIDDGEAVQLGGRDLRFFETRGHANHHHCIFDAGSNGVFTGDSFGIVYPHLQTNGLLAFPTTTPTDFDAAEAKKSLDSITGTGAERVFLTHFGERTDVAAIAEALRPQLDDYGALVERADASGAEGEALEAMCREGVRELFSRQLTTRGLPPDPAPDPILGTDCDLNAQGVAFAVKKRRFKREG